MKITQVMHRRKLKRFTVSPDTLLFFRAGNFCRTFESDALFLSAKFGFQVLQKGDYVVVGFPLSAEQKYLSLLSQQGYAYQVLEVKNDLPVVQAEKRGNEPLSYDPQAVFFREVSPQRGISPEGQPAFSAFLQDLHLLVQKYL